MLRLLAVIVWGAVATFLLVACGQEEPDRPRTVREQIEDCLSPLDGHHSGFEDQIRPLLNDEGSMRTHETYFNASPDVSCTGCRGNNETSIRMVIRHTMPSGRASRSRLSDFSTTKPAGCELPAPASNSENR